MDRVVRISVILCTYNRCQSLAAALESVLASEMPPSASWEVLVVDNNSRDQTRQIVADLAVRHAGKVRYLFEGKQGKSHALNSGIREARGEILAFMDDDVAVDCKWLQRLTAILEADQWAGVGGRILPEREFSPPPWLRLDGRYALAPLAIFDLGPEASELHEPPFGTNMAFRKHVFEKIGVFRTDLGPCPGSETRGEDTEFGDRALAAGMRLWYEPSAVVYHSLPAQRLKKQYFLAWWHDKGRSTIRQDGIPGDARWFVAGVPLHLFRRFGVWTVRWFLTAEPGRRFSSRLNAYSVLGMIRECRQLNRIKNQRETTATPLRMRH